MGTQKQENMSVAEQAQHKAKLGINKISSAMKEAVKDDGGIFHAKNLQAEEQMEF